MYRKTNYEKKKELKHHGIKGQQWGVRRYQNKDGSLTTEGKEHYSAYQVSKELDAKRYLESTKLIGSSKYLQEAFGDDSDDPDFIEYVAWEYNDYNGGAKINFEKLLNANANYSKFVKENRESIEIGRSIARELGLE